MKFLVPNYSCLQNPWLGGYRPQIPILSVLNWICWTSPPPQKKKKFLGMPLTSACWFTLLNKQILLLHTCVLSWCLFQYMSYAFYLIMFSTAQNYGTVRQQWNAKAVERRVCVLLSSSYISTWSLQLRKNTNKFKPRVSIHQLRNKTGTFSGQVRNINLWTKWTSINTTILFFGPCIFNNEDKNKPTKCTN